MTVEGGYNARQDELFLSELSEEYRLRFARHYLRSLVSTGALDIAEAAIEVPLSYPEFMKVIYEIVTHAADRRKRTLQRRFRQYYLAFIVAIVFGGGGYVLGVIGTQTMMLVGILLLFSGGALILAWQIHVRNIDSEVSGTAVVLEEVLRIIGERSDASVIVLEKNLSFRQGR